METVDLGNGVFVDDTEGHVVQRNTARRRRGGPALAQGDEIDAALDDALLDLNFELAGDAIIAPSVGEPEIGARRRRSRGEDAEQPVLKVSVAPDEDAVLLLENDEGVLQWQFPDEGAKVARGRRSAGENTLTFSLGVAEGDAPDAASGRRRRGLAGDAVRWVGRKLAGRIRVRVLRFVAEIAIDKAVAKIEGNTPTGLVVMGDDPAAWLPDGSVPALPDNRKPRVLLFVHGTFSTTLGSFGGLHSTREGKAFLGQAKHYYDAVIGYDHLTLDQDPLQNATDILKALDFLPAGTTLDTIGYSRGGLVMRTLTEDLLPKHRPDLTVEKQVFVGCTNAGTQLAEPDNWRALIDLYTNIAVAGGRALSLLASPVAGTAVNIAVRTLGSLVKALPEIAIEDERPRVPGLAAMEPDGDFVAAINTHTGSTKDYFAVASDFEPRIDRAKGLSGGLAQMLADRVMDRLMGEENDLVVHTASMTNLGGARGFAEAQVHRIAPGDAIYHTIYFITPKVAEMLAEWLYPPQQQQQQQQQISPDFEIDRDQISKRITEIERERRSFEIDRSILDPAREIRIDEDAVSPRQMRRRRSESSPTSTGGVRKRRSRSAKSVDTVPPAQPVECHIAAEMNPTPLLGGVAPLFVTISREQIRVAAHQAAATAGFAAKEDEPLDIEVLALENCWVSCDDPDAEVEENGASAAIAVAMPQHSEVIRFTVEGAEPGKAKLQIEVSQGLVPLASFQLIPTFINPEAEMLSAKAVATPVPPSKDQPAVMRIYEQSIPGLGLMLKYDLLCIDPPMAEKHEVTLHRDFNIGAFCAEFLAELEDAYDMGDLEYDAFLERISSFSAVKTNEIIPKEIRQAIWDNRKDLRAIQVLAENPYIPWELLYIEDPSGMDPGNGSFLSEMGLVRWMYNAKMPAERMEARGANTRFVIPDYLNQADKLPGADLERDMVKAMFPGASPIEASSKGVKDFLLNEAAECDILHFACHGLAEQRSVLSSDLLLSELQEKDGRLSADKLTTDFVKRYAKFGEKLPSCMVLVNACQTGKPGLGVAGVSGFADSFLRPNSRRGAAAFIGALWKVDDQLALTFAKTLYNAMLHDGLTLVEASKVAREACKDKYDYTWLAYSIYGNPLAKFET